MLFNVMTISALASAGVHAQASWNRRVCYDDLGCNGNMIQGIQVYSPVTPCAPGLMPK
jgi:hypothetical protein